MARAKAKEAANQARQAAAEVEKTFKEAIEAVIGVNIDSELTIEEVDFPAVKVEGRIAKLFNSSKQKAEAASEVATMASLLKEVLSAADKAMTEAYEARVKKCLMLIKGLYHF